LLRPIMAPGTPMQQLLASTVSTVSTPPNYSRSTFGVFKPAPKQPSTPSVGITTPGPGTSQTPQVRSQSKVTKTWVKPVPGLTPLTKGSQALPTTPAKSSGVSQSEAATPAPTRASQFAQPAAAVTPASTRGASHKLALDHLPGSLGAQFEAIDKSAAPFIMPLQLPPAVSASQRPVVEASNVSSQLERLRALAKQGTSLTNQLPAQPSTTTSASGSAASPGVPGSAAAAATTPGGSRPLPVGKAMQQLQAAGYSPDFPAQGAAGGSGGGGGTGDTGGSGNSMAVVVRQEPSGPIASRMEQQLQRLRALQLQGQSLLRA